MNSSNVTFHLNKDILCLEKSTLSEKLRMSSILFITLGGLLSTIVFTINFISIIFFIKNKKSKRSPQCIYTFFLSVLNLVKQSEYYLATLVKLKLIDTENQKYILYNKESKLIKSNDFICKWINFLPTFSAHVSVYLVLMLHLQRYLTIKIKLTSFSLLLYNHALTYFICFALILIIFIIDEFYLFDGYFITIIYCSFTMVYTCVINDDFKLLKRLKFDTLMYHHVHTFIYNILPFILVLILNILIFIGLRERSKEVQNRMRTISIGSNGHTSSAIIKENNSKRKRLSSTNSTYSPVRNYTRLVRRPKKEILIPKFNLIFLYQSDIGYSCILVGFLQILNTFPVNMLSYLTEWNNQTIERVRELVNANEDILFNPKARWNVPNRLFGNEFGLSQVELYFFYILLGTFEVFNFNFYLIYQLYSSKSFLKELKNTLFKK